MLSRILQKTKLKPQTHLLKRFTRPSFTLRNFSVLYLNNQQKNFPLQKKNPKIKLRLGNKLTRSFSTQSKVTLEQLEDKEFINSIAEKYEFVKEGKEKVVGYWMLLLAGTVAVMIVVGGYTRLSKSGLSMTKWKPIGYKYPRDLKEWEEEFDNYKVDFLN